MPSPAFRFPVTLITPQNLTVSPDGGNVYLTTYDRTTFRYLANIVTRPQPA